MAFIEPAVVPGLVVSIAKASQNWGFLLESKPVLTQADSIYPPIYPSYILFRNDKEKRQESQNIEIGPQKTALSMSNGDVGSHSFCS